MEEESTLRKHGPKDSLYLMYMCIRGQHKWFDFFLTQTHFIVEATEQALLPQIIGIQIPKNENRENGQNGEDMIAIFRP